MLIDIEISFLLLLFAVEQPQLLDMKHHCKLLHGARYLTGTPGSWKGSEHPCWMYGI